MSAVAIVGAVRQEDTARQEELWDADTARRYDTPGTGMFAPDVLGPTARRLAELASGGPALEFAIGTGRVALALAGLGVPVTGIELSRPMIEQLRTKADESTIPVVVGDMATALAPGQYSLVYLVYNTISNLLTQAEQVACFRNAARHLTPGGRFVIELWVPELRKLPPLKVVRASSAHTRRKRGQLAGSSQAARGQLADSSSSPRLTSAEHPFDT
jgi:SAM-dependent methyltransferase